MAYEKIIIKINDRPIIVRTKGEELISLSDLARGHEEFDKFTLRHWMREPTTIPFLYKWEKSNNPNFKDFQIKDFIEAAEQNRYLYHPKNWIDHSDAKGLLFKRGRYGGLFAQHEIALNFCLYLFPDQVKQFQKEFQKLN